ncbi:MAG: HAD-IIA family hydrolase [Chromatiales bacterium]|jgi:glycerol-1-phosphatase|nr:HAD-IIA family hydrolase [Chromatiales bacterium]
MGRSSDTIDGKAVDTEWVVSRYESIRHWLPKAAFSAHTPTPAANLLAVADAFDVFLLDAFGVLNVGEEPITSAPPAVAALQAMGKTVFVLTNGATATARDAKEKYAHWGFDFSLDKVISSRDVLMQALAKEPRAMTWGVSAPTHARIDELPVNAIALDGHRETYDAVDGFILLSTHSWPPERQAHLEASLGGAPRPVFVGNPDIAAPRPDGFSLEPGHYAFILAEQGSCSPRLFGKPFDNAFDEVKRRLNEEGLGHIDASRIAMVGDSLHTDILGGAAAGFKTILVTTHGLFKGAAPDHFMAECAIFPDFIVPTT